jgi:hypothetical protein
MADLITHLPTDEFPPTNDEKDMIKWMFNIEKKNPVPKITTKDPPSNQIPNKGFFSELKTILIIFILYLVFSNLYLKSFIQKILPVANKLPILLNVIQAILFTMVMYFYLNWFYC